MATVVRVKFQVVNIEPGTVNVGSTDEDGNYQSKMVPTATIVMCPVYGGSPENDAFFAATPAGEIKFSTVNLAAASAFPAGAEIYADFTLAS